MRELPKIVKDAARVRAMVEEAVVRMHIKHRHLSGTEIRAAAFRVVRSALAVWRAKGNQLPLMRALGESIDDLKLHLQLAKDVNAFRSWKEFEALVRLVDEVGRQSGGWLKRRIEQGQNARAATPRAQRAQTLSSRPASPGASL